MVLMVVEEVRVVVVCNRRARRSGRHRQTDGGARNREACYVASGHLVDFQHRAMDVLRRRHGDGQRGAAREVRGLRSEV